MREIRLYGSEGGGAARSPYPYVIEPRRGGGPTRSTLSPNTFAGLGERVGVRGRDQAELRKSRFVPRNVWRTTKRKTRHSVTNGPPLPTSPPESQKGGDSGGEENNGLER